MNRTLTVALVCVVLVAGVSADFSDFFGKSFTDYTSLFAKDQGSLLSNVDKLKWLLQMLQAKGSGNGGTGSGIADAAQKLALGKVGGWLSGVTSFKNKVAADGHRKFAENKNTWEDKLKTMFVKEGLQKLVGLVVPNSSGHLFAPVLTILCALISVRLYM